MRHALTRAEAIALQERLGRPITWAPRHHHGSPEGLLQQKDSPGRIEPGHAERQRGVSDLPTPATFTPAPWVEQAACRGMDPRQFHPKRGEYAKLRQARDICAGCPVRGECLQAALDDPGHMGVMGGTTADERRGMHVGRSQTWRAEQRAAQRAVAPINHGTYGGYLAHRKRGEEACPECRWAHYDYKRDYTARKAERRARWATSAVRTSRADAPLTPSGTPHTEAPRCADDAVQPHTCHTAASVADPSVGEVGGAVPEERSRPNEPATRGRLGGHGEHPTGSHADFDHGGHLVEGAPVDAGNTVADLQFINSLGGHVVSQPQTPESVNHKCQAAS